ncbi:MAG: hypothetical protein QOE84_733, partial [Actinomycetota bacterium]|nr:hypothetical protein [Actinomycetota bacterium]
PDKVALLPNPAIPGLTVLIGMVKGSPGWALALSRRSVCGMTVPDYRELPKRVDLVETVEEYDVSTPPAPVEGLPQPDKDWFAAGG